MSGVWQRGNEKFAQMSMREKLLISLCGLVAVVFGLLTLVVEPMYLTNQQLNRQIDNIELNNQQLEADTLVMQAKLNRDPDLELDKQLKQLMIDSQQSSQQLAQMVESLITPSEMARMLETVLLGSQRLKLMSLESLPSEPIVPPDEQHGITGYFLHPVRIELSGRYFDIVNFLETLEGMPVKYYWRSFDYQVESYPQSRLVLTVYTLGTRQEFIGG
ncbi:MSHA biogenesis protein MshJ [Vibrio sp. JPW-9-11-11]|uniref:MSHA biogenesis protein MshJ n=1 Tax=Vibrio sp. JPW-9-11-11 TaxID=1416532 RepID=UPI001593A52E|nr:MSHA biogenesis protein MshJ [Vibrio sp. JPW-9-11-11]NVD07592.1 MSHA biogenesis protein MshJ [Vibrio sp. JPW-9-11-11]